MGLSGRTASGIVGKVWGAGRTVGHLWQEVTTRYPDGPPGDPAGSRRPEVMSIHTRGAGHSSGHRRLFRLAPARSDRGTARSRSDAIALVSMFAVRRSPGPAPTQAKRASIPRGRRNHPEPPP